nr:hypothetical protein [Kibdelosporangium sp. MJ126-NF4]
MSEQATAVGVFGYTPDRYEALRLTSHGGIVAVDGMLRHREGEALESGVFASLLALQGHGYLAAHLPPSGTGAGMWPVRLTLTGTGLLAGFQHDHAHHTEAQAEVDRAPAHADPGDVR